MNKVFLILSVLVLGFMVSCTTISTLYVDQIKPAELNFPHEIRTVAVVDNLPFPPNRWPDNYTLDDTDEVIDGDGKEVSGALAQYLADGNYFDQVVICDSVLKEKHADKKFSVLKQEDVKKMSEELGADLIVSVDQVAVKARPDVLFSFDTQEIAGVVNVTVSVLARLYIPSRAQPMAIVTDRDSTFWYSNAVDQTEILEKTTDWAGSLLVRHLIPEWVTVPRYYYTGGLPDLRDGEYLVRNGKWEEALAIWKNLYDSGSRKKQKYAAFNIALYYEMQDNFDEAQAWLAKAMESVPDSGKSPGDESPEYRLMKNYLSELGNRKEEVQKLNLQMDRFGKND